MTTKGPRTGRSYPDLAHLFFSIHKPISFKKLNATRRDDKIHKHVSIIFDFCFLFFYICFFIFIILKLIYLIKDKNIMNFYKLFIQKHYNYFFEEILIIIIIYIKI